MAGVDLGLKPIALKVNLARGGSFTTTLHNQEDNWHPGILVVLVFEGPLNMMAEDKIYWTATLNGADAVWDRDPPDVTEIIDGLYTVVRLHYVEPDGSVFVWGSGKVNVF